jgi:hypothetical protein
MAENQLLHRHFDREQPVINQRIKFCGIVIGAPELIETLVPIVKLDVLQEQKRVLIAPLVHTQ